MAIIIRPPAAGAEIGSPSNEDIGTYPFGAWQEHSEAAERFNIDPGDSIADALKKASLPARTPIDLPQPFDGMRQWGQPIFRPSYMGPEGPQPGKDCVDYLSVYAGNMALGGMATNAMHVHMLRRFDLSMQNLWGGYLYLAAAMAENPIAIFGNTAKKVWSDFGGTMMLTTYTAKSSMSCIVEFNTPIQQGQTYYIEIYFNGDWQQFYADWDGSGEELRARSLIAEKIVTLINEDADCPFWAFFYGIDEVEQQFTNWGIQLLPKMYIESNFPFATNFPNFGNPASAEKPGGPRMVRVSGNGSIADWYPTGTDGSTVTHWRDSAGPAIGTRRFTDVELVVPVLNYPMEQEPYTGGQQGTYYDDQGGGHPWDSWGPSFIWFRFAYDYTGAVAPGPIYGDDDWTSREATVLVDQPGNPPGF